jgi:phosphohistidine phosphatase
MNLYLVQHGEAKSKAEDPARPLADRGAEVVRRMAEWSATRQLAVDQIRHSGKRRAEETAELFAQRLKPAGGVVAVSGMGPTDDVRPIATAVDREEQDIMLVGHLPFLGRLASQLVIGNADRNLIRFQNAGIVCLSHDEGDWLIRWTMVPELLG